MRRMIGKKLRSVGTPFLCLLLSVIFALALNLIPQASAQQVAEQARADELKKLAERMEKLFHAAAKEIPRDTFDPQAIIDKVGKDPLKLFDWVRDNTYLVPYRGVLRDYKGVLMDRLAIALTGRCCCSFCWPALAKTSCSWRTPSFRTSRPNVCLIRHGPSRKKSP